MTSAHRGSPVLTACIGFLRLVGSTLPAAERREWIKEWTAELRGEWLDLEERGRLSLLQRAALVRRCLGALVDAAHFWIEAIVMTLFDLRNALRAPLRDVRTTLVVMLTLALSIGANTALFSVIYNVLLRPLAYPEADRLVMIWDQAVDEPEITSVISPRNFEDWREQSSTLDHFSAFNLWSVTLDFQGDRRRVPGLVTTGDYFNALQVQPMLGRTFTPDDNRSGAEPVVVISHGLWQRRFGGDSSIVGHALPTLGATPTIVGVMPPGFRDPGSFFFATPDVWGTFRRDFLDESRTGRWMRTVARLKPGVTLEQAQDEMTAVARGLAEAYPRANADWTAKVIPLHQQVVGDVRQPLWILTGAVALVLLIACANVANLMLSQAASRNQEFAVRTALGAARTRIVAQLLAENLVLAIIGGAAGVALAHWGVRALVGLAPDLPRAETIGLAVPVLGFALLVTVGTGLLFGLAPALQAGGVDLHTALKAGGRGSEGHERRRLRSILMVSEIALSLLLLIGAGLLTKSFLQLRGTDPGFDESNVLTLRLNLSRSMMGVESNFMTTIARRIEALPDVESAGAVSTLPLHGLNNVGLGWQLTGLDTPLSEPVPAGYREVTPHYFPAMGIETLSGRSITDADRDDTPTVAVVNDEFVRRYMNGEDPMGKQVSSGLNGSFTAEIVGVIRGVQYVNLESPAEPEVYVPHAQRHVLPVMFLAVRTAGDPLASIPASRRTLRELYPDMVVDDVSTMEQLVAGSVARPRFNMLLIGIFSLTALVLAAVGLYAVLAYSVARRVHEVGIRMALGASRGNVHRMVVFDGLKLVIVGGALGLGAAFALTRVLRSLLFNVTVTDPATFVTVPAVVIVVALLASYLPARRAALLDPNVALRRE
jgi:putative ABC transport system permease protein